MNEVRGSKGMVVVRNDDEGDLGSRHLRNKYFQRWIGLRVLHDDHHSSLTLPRTRLSRRLIRSVVPSGRCPQKEK